VETFFSGGRELEHLCVKGGVVRWGECWEADDGLEDLDKIERELASILACDVPRLRTFTISGVGVLIEHASARVRRDHPFVGAAYLVATHQSLLTFLTKMTVSWNRLHRVQGQAGGLLTCGWSGLFVGIAMHQKLSPLR
jgi:hypothetical protein